MITSAKIEWKDLCEDPRFRDLPYKIETDGQGRIIMSPMQLRHGFFKNKVARLLEKHLPDGVVVTECAIRTTDGTRVADAAWFTKERWDSVRDEFDAPIAPEICVEVASPSNTVKELTQKKELYFVAGALEFWLVDLEGRIQFFQADSAAPESNLAPIFPRKIEIE